MQINKCNTAHKQNKGQKKNHTIISIDTEKAFDYIQYPCMIRSMQKLGIKGVYLYITKAIYDKGIAS
jgi:hypothetical protein